MRTILHIGAEKTGTTALQRSFTSSLDRLADAGVCYPKTLWGNQHYALALYAMDDSRSHILLDRNQRFRADRDVWRQKLTERLASAVESGPETLLLSSEIMAAQLVDVDEITRLRTLLDRWSEEYVVVLYMRRQDRATTSLYSTDLRVGSTSPDIFGPHPFTPVGFDYARVLDLWSEVFGADAVRPRVYETARAAEDGLLGDFVRCTGLPVPASSLEQPPGAANRALSAKAQQALLVYNRLTGGRPATTPEDVAARHALVHEVSRRFAGPARRPSRAEAIAYVDRFGDGNARVARDWFGGGDLFDDSYEEYPEHADPTPDIDAEEVMAVAAGLAARAAEAKHEAKAAERRLRRRKRAGAAQEPPETKAAERRARRGWRDR